jgi:hypothetical protein
MILFKGDTVKLKSGENAEVLDIWGIARTWCKLRTSDGKISFAMADKIESVESSASKKARTTNRESSNTPAMNAESQMTLF